MKYETVVMVFGIIVISISMPYLIYYAREKSDIKAETINENIQKMSKSCIEDHNGTFTLRFEHGDRNTVTYECTYN